jgi:hypothetical protein
MSLASFIRLSIIAVAVGLSLAACTLAPQRTAGPAALVEKIDITARKSAFGGTQFAGVGAYEFIAGVATVSVDPTHTDNRRIVDLGLAADSDGKVRYRTDVALLRPADAAKASRVLVVEIANRGAKQALIRLADGAIQYDTAAQAGHGWFMRQGHTLAWVGWQGDVPLGKEGQVIGTSFPVARAGGQSIVADSVAEFIFDDAAARSRAAITYAAADPNSPSARLTVQARVGEAVTDLPRTAWRFIGEREVEIDRPPQFDGGAIYTLTYPARDPRPMGLGMAALRDVTLFLKGTAPDAAGQPNPLVDIRPQTTVVLGISQSGRFLRDFIWEGFNAAPGGGRVFDAAMPLITGSRKSYVNMRFAQPGRYSRQHEDHFYPGDQFPFTYATTTDPITGHTDGIFARCAATRTCPKLMHLDSNLEFWQARASLTTHDGEGRPVPVPSDVRFYLMGSTQHVSAAQSVANICHQPNNTAVQTPLVRAAMANLIAWARDGKEPPASRYPLKPADLAPLDRAAVGFPDLSPIGVRFPSVMNELVVVDHSKIPFRPDPARRYASWLPRTDQDGHDIAAVRLPDVAVPLATHSGWNLRRAGFAEGALCGLNGIQIPLAKDGTERSTKGDPRRSIAERYTTRTDYVQQVEMASRRLQAEGFLLEEDVLRIVDRAQREPRVAHLAP